jgi:hypothetical protein
LGWLFYLDFKVSIFYIEYKNKLRKWPPFTKMLYQENTIMGPTLHP